MTSATNYLNTPSTRAQVITRRTYNRPLNDEGTVFETWEQTVDRVISHQRWLWEQASGRELTLEEDAELHVLRRLMEERKAFTSGRVLWLGGTELIKRRASAAFNCSFLRVETVSDVADAGWLLLQGCGVGFEPITGVLSGFTSPLKVEVVHSKRTSKGGAEHNHESVKKGVWTIKIGDSAEAWAKATAKVLANKTKAHTLVLDFSEVRPAGERLKGYGWISSGHVPFATALENIAGIMNRKAGQLLNRIDILDIMNHIGTILSSRRSAEIALVPWADPEAEAFAVAKRDWWSPTEDRPGGNPQRQQSNNSLLFYSRPTKYELHYVFDLMQRAGGSEPGFINAQEAYRRAPWFKGVNPCAEILLGNRGFCNLCELDAGKFNGDMDGFLTAAYVIARANYRQTCVNLKDGVLQDSWHELNTFLRLCGVGVTGIVRWEGSENPDMIQALRKAAQDGANTMADELSLPRAKAITTLKPSGSLSKIADTTEGIHKPLGRYIFNNVNFSKYDPIVSRLKDAGYKILENPTDDTAVLVCFPVCYEDVEFDIVDGKAVNLESAVSQLERYKTWMLNYADHNVSITISYSPEEVPAIIDWLIENWSIYVGVSFIYRNDPTKTAADLGYQYLPQEVVTQEVYEAYVASLLPLDWSGTESFDEIADPCSTGACPIK